VIAVPSDGDGPYGILSASSMANVTFTDVGGGVYTINVTASKAVDNNRCHVQLESTLVPFLVPPLHWSGSVDAVLVAGHRKYGFALGMV
jgi:hypothetical protein